MNNLFGDIYNLLKSLRWFDFVFICLVILLLVTFITIIYLLKVNKTEINSEESYEDDFDLEEVTKQIEDEYENLNIKKNNTYEQAQEEQAIISYEELLANTGEYHLEYDEDYQSDLEIEVKKIKKAVPVDNKYVEEEKFLEYLQTLKNK